MIYDRDMRQEQVDNNQHILNSNSIWGSAWSSINSGLNLVNKKKKHENRLQDIQAQYNIQIGRLNDALSDAIEYANREYDDQCEAIYR